MLLKPFHNNDPNQILNPDIEVPSNLDDALQIAGLVNTKVDNINPIKDIFTNAGASPKDIAKNVAHIMVHGDTDAARLKACEIASKVQGIMADIDEAKIPEININIVGQGNRTIVNLVMPNGN